MGFVAEDGTDGKGKQHKSCGNECVMSSHI
jgi:hypothetical protein